MSKKYTHIEHLTLTTGHTRASPRSEVSKEALDLLWPIVVAGGGEIADTGWSLRMITGEEPGGAGFTLKYEGRWLVSAYMAWREPGADEMWKTASATFRHLGRSARGRPRRLPWLAVVLMPEAFIPPQTLDAYLAHSRVMSEAGDLERIVAWAVLDAFVTPEVVQ